MLACPGSRQKWMDEACGGYARDAAAGVDGVATAQYEAEWDANLTKLLERFQSGWYRAPAVRRVHDGEAGDGEDALHLEGACGRRDTLYIYARCCTSMQREPTPPEENPYPGP